MPRLIASILALALSLAPALASEPLRLLVKTKPGAPPARLEEALARASLQGARIPWVSRTTSWRVVELPEGRDPESAARWLASDPQVAAVEVERVAHVTAVLPNDLMSSQWFLDNTGQAVNGSGGMHDADIDAPEAWDLTRGSRDVRVAILDTGVLATHPDLEGNLSSAFGLLGRGLSSDDDAGLGHGTPIAGIIGAVGDNGVGMAGINWSVSLLSGKVCDAAGRCPYGAVAAGIEQAVAAGARVLNLSFACDEHQDPRTGSCGASRPGACWSAALHDALAAAGEAGVLVVTPAGNCGADLDDRTASYPCAYPLDNVLCVAATDARDELAYFSNHGARVVRLAAPGTEILSLSTSPGDNWLWNGTSFAAPMVTGVAALQLARQEGFTPAALVERLMAGDRLASLDGQVARAARLNAMASVADLFLSPRELLRSRGGSRNLVGDFNGDGLADLCEIGSAGYRVGLNEAGNIAPPVSWSSSRGVPAAEVGDFDGDGRDDLARPGRNGIEVLLSLGDRFDRPRRWTSAAWKSWTNAGDVNGDGRDDLLRYRGDRKFSVSLSTGAAFAPSARWASASPGSARALADVDGDGRADLIIASGSRTHVRLSTGASFSTASSLPTGSTVRLLAGDVDGDGDDDLARLGGDGCWRVSDAAAGAPGPGRPWACESIGQPWSPALSDVDGDGRADLVGLSAARGAWQVMTSTH
jgi:subtilisin family serine protease